MCVCERERERDKVPLDPKPKKEPRYVHDCCPALRRRSDTVVAWDYVRKQRVRFRNDAFQLFVDKLTGNHHKERKKSGRGTDERGSRGKAVPKEQYDAVCLTGLQAAY